MLSRAERVEQDRLEARTWDDRYLDNVQIRLNEICRKLGKSAYLGVAQSGNQGFYIYDIRSGKILTGNGKTGRTPRILDQMLDFFESVEETRLW